MRGGGKNIEYPARADHLRPNFGNVQQAWTDTKLADLSRLADWNSNAGTNDRHAESLRSCTYILIKTLARIRHTRRLPDESTRHYQEFVAKRISDSMQSVAGGEVVSVWLPRALVQIMDGTSTAQDHARWSLAAIKAAISVAEISFEGQPPPNRTLHVAISNVHNLMSEMIKETNLAIDTSTPMPTVVE